MKAGDRVKLRGAGDIGVVLAMISAATAEVAFSAGVKSVQVSDLEKLPAEPVDALLAGDVGSAERWGLRLQALYLKHAYRYDELSGLSNARVEPQLHQVYVAHRVMNKIAPRMILSDEVGLGKTIEAGLILKELRARQLVERVLVVCPASLQMQWQQELRSKFNEEFLLMDGIAAKHLAKGEANPFQRAGNVIVSHNFAAMPKRSEQIVEAGWDLVIFDEAHRVRRRLQGGSPVTTRAYELADELKDLADGFLLLTATPMQLSPYELWSHIELIEPGLYPSYSEYEYRRRSLPRLNDAMKALQGWGALGELDRAAFLRSDAARTVAALADIDPADLAARLDDASARETLKDQLVDEHPLSRVLVRNRKANIEGFAQRDARRIPVAITDDERDLYDAVTEYLRYGYNLALERKNNAIGFLMVGYHKMLASSPAALAESLKKRSSKLRKQVADLSDLADLKPKNVAPKKLEDLREGPELSEALAEFENTVLDPEALEWELQRLEELVERIEESDDSKAEQLVASVMDILEAQPDEKILIFTQFVETQTYLRDLLEHFEISVQIFNGRLSLEEKEEAVRRFRSTDSVLISTEAGGEGRNFQFAHILFNYDLPWNPMKVEQRIGRLDRIGQRRDVWIYNLYRTDTIEERVLDVLDKRIGLFEESVGTLDPILGEVETDLENLVKRHLSDLDEAITNWADKDLDTKIKEARELEHTLGDFVMDRASLREERAKQLIANNGPMARAADLRTYVGSVVEHWGGTAVERDEGDVVVTLPPALAHKLKVATGTHIGVFDPERALRLEDRDFFAFGHELVDGLADLPIHDDAVAATIQAREDVPSGTWLEIVYEVTTRGVATSGRLMRHRVGEDGVVLVEVLQQLPPIGKPADGVDVPDWVASAVTASRERAIASLEDERRAAQERDDVAKAERLSRVERVYQHSKERLQRRIDQLQDQIGELDRFGTEKQRKVIPALKGQVAANRQRIDNLELSYEDDVARLKALKSDSTLQVLAASVVVQG